MQFRKTQRQPAALIFIGFMAVGRLYQKINTENQTEVEKKTLNKRNKKPKKFKRRVRKKHWLKASFF